MAHKHKDLSPSNQCLGLCQFTFCHKLSCLPGEIFTRHCASTVKHGMFNAHIRILRYLVRTSFEDHIKIPPSQIRDPKSPVGSLRGNFLVCRTCHCETFRSMEQHCHAIKMKQKYLVEALRHLKTTWKASWAPHPATTASLLSTVDPVTDLDG